MIVKVVGRNRWIRGLVWLGWIGFMLLIIKDIIRSREVESKRPPPGLKQTIGVMSGAGLQTPLTLGPDLYSQICQRRRLDSCRTVVTSGRAYLWLVSKPEVKMAFLIPKTTSSGLRT
jgi:hypothetical protein